MHEILPIVAGIAIGFLAQRLPSFNLRIITLSMLSVLYGVCASYISGELLISWSYILIDTALVMLSAVVTVAATKWWTHRTSRLP
ncbi:MAG: hypothetical protein M3R24_39660 [Chloroflexota bacterium]|nr:hypothetical protein [Chloroflexota bacterium]